MMIWRLVVWYNTKRTFPLTPEQLVEIYTAINKSIKKDTETANNFSFLKFLRPLLPKHVTYDWRVPSKVKEILDSKVSK